MAFIETTGINGIIKDAINKTHVFPYSGGTLQQAIQNYGTNRIQT